jgi:hypothetical protein
MVPQLCRKRGRRGQKPYHHGERKKEKDRVKGKK